MIRLMRRATWNPYLAGALVGVLAMASAVATSLLLGKAHYLGASTTFVRVAGLLEQLVLPGRVVHNVYFQTTRLGVDWQMLFVAGIFVGSFVSALMGRSLKAEAVPPLWAAHAGRGAVRRAVAAFAGGALALFGARLAGGCPSGHGLSGMMQLSASGLLAMLCFMAGGMVAARLVYRRRRR